jgi:hypothetical protein
MFVWIVWNFGDGVCCFLLGDHSIFRLSTFIMLRIDLCGKALYVVYVVIACWFVIRRCFVLATINVVLVFMLFSYNWYCCGGYRSLGRYSSLADSDHGVFFFVLWWVLTFLIVVFLAFSPGSFLLWVLTCFSEANCYFLLSYKLFCYNGYVMFGCVRLCVYFLYLP